jgi:aldose 1-epimerase
VRLPGQLKQSTIQNANGLRMTVINFGARLMSLWVPDQKGQFKDIVLGYDTPEEYFSGNLYFGATIGRFANRLANASFQLNGKVYQLQANNGRHTLHSGSSGFQQVLWSMSEEANRVRLWYESPDGDGGFPGHLKAEVTYELTETNEVLITYKATTDAPTVVNLTHHSFFNLAGEGNPSIENHILAIDADRFCEIGDGLIPTGRLLSVQDTPFDFRQPARIEERIDRYHDQLKYAKGYDHNWVLNKKNSEFALAAHVEEPGSGRVMEVWTTEPGLQFYSGNFLDGKDQGKDGKNYPYRSALCLETQHFPDSPNHPDFPSTVLMPEEVYFQQTAYRFRIDKQYRKLT